MNKWWWFAIGLGVGVIAAPKLRAIVPVKLPSVG